MKNTPIVPYDEIRTRFEADGIDLGDIHGSSRHFTAWHARNGLAETDAEGKHFSSSSLFMTQYDAAPDGRSERPAYVNFWHWLIDVYDCVPWKEMARGRSKLVYLDCGMHHPRTPPTEGELQAAIARLTCKIPMPHDMRTSVEAQLRLDIGEQAVRHNESLKIVERIHDLYGDHIRIRMTV